MAVPKIRIALVILEDRQGRFALQLRSPIPAIANPDRWGIFGGHIEAGEEPKHGALREIEEELACRLEPSKLIPTDDFSQTAEKHYYVFYYPVTAELDKAVLMEGEDFGFFSFQEIQKGEIAGKEVVTHHLQMLEAFQKTNNRS